MVNNTNNLTNKNNLTKAPSKVSKPYYSRRRKYLQDALLTEIEALCSRQLYVKSSILLKHNNNYGSSKINKNYKTLVFKFKK